jgi:hypothetical protein
MIEDVERSGGDPADLLRRTIIRDIDIPEPAEEHETFAERARRIGEEGSSYDEALERSDHDPTAESAFDDRAPPPIRRGTASRVTSRSYRTTPRYTTPSTRVRSAQPPTEPLRREETRR